MTRLKRLARRARLGVIRWERDILALAAIACIAAGLSTISIALSWLAVGVFLFVAASGPRKGGA